MKPTLTSIKELNKKFEEYLNDENLWPPNAIDTRDWWVKEFTLLLESLKESLEGEKVNIKDLHHRSTTSKEIEVARNQGLSVAQSLISSVMENK